MNVDKQRLAIALQQAVRAQILVWDALVEIEALLGQDVDTLSDYVQAVAAGNDGYDVRWITEEEAERMMISVGVLPETNQGERE